MSQSELFEVPDPEVGDVEDALEKRGRRVVIGVDEAGRGPLAGPVVAAAFVLRVREALPDQLQDLDDSKKLEAADRERLYRALTDGTHAYGVAASEADIIDDINVLEATFRAMRMVVGDAIDALGEEPDVVLVDGNMTIPEGTWRQQAIVGGDGRSTAIAAASIVAKVTRDRRMEEAGQQWPQYGFASHKGYPTASHREAIKEHGPCPLHRRSFSGVVTERGE